MFDRLGMMGPQDGFFCSENNICCEIPGDMRHPWLTEFVWPKFQGIALTGMFLLSWLHMHMDIDIF